MARYVEKKHAPMVDFGPVSWKVETNGNLGLGRISVNGDAVDSYLRARIRSALTDAKMTELDEAGFQARLGLSTPKERNAADIAVRREGIVAEIMKEQA